MRPAPRRVLVVGASAAGLSVVEGLRRAGYEDALTLVGDEPHLPYDRPPLSKQLLSGAWHTEKLTLRPAEAYQDLGVELELGTPAASLDASAREVRLTDGTALGYDALVVATGVRARALPGIDGIEGVHLLRNLEDALALQRSLAARPHLAIVGGGFIGAEAAAVARELGCRVTMITDRPVPLSDAVGAEVGDMLTTVHRDHGVDIVTEAMVESVTSEKGRATGVRLVDGRIVDADIVVIGIGTRPNVEWLAGSGIPLGNGVECDETLSAGNGIWAAGDVASFPDPDTGERIRIEHRTNASEQGSAVARNILARAGEATPFRSVPYVWSDQYDLKIQIYGRSRGADRIHVVDGDIAERKFTALCARDGRVTAALGVNMVRPLRALRSVVADRTDWTTAMAAHSPAA
ncbi:NAD(P)/FAD-dependent oxidoreductase [Nocardia jinanensis]|uniref:Pyridine nucleotide-disulfide oxidoreductase n=1 Tax=Nocardia jinanensis TaxID=382504 RepID=A0A917RNK5_9NOCA|nr:FAD/NAD(P)-binding oxidoreductase [Nocardia jinanensis]GGL15478.1 pyridine nucleotide-disulfide oxidoreductase [Nocardia jinanensis]